MTNYHESIFDRLRLDTAVQLGGVGGRRRVRRWTEQEPGLADLEPGQLLDRAPTAEAGQARLAALVRLASSDQLAAQAVLAVTAPGLTAAAGALSRSWGLDRQEADQAVAAAAWERITSLAGQTLSWPATAIVLGARCRVRNRLVTEARRERLAAQLPPSGPSPSPEEELVGRRVLVEASSRCVITRDEAALIWATRVMGYGLAELAGPGRTESTLRVRRWRAERALRAEVA